MSNAENGGVSQGGEPDFFSQPLAVTPDEVEQQPAKFGPGRPKGSKNRSSEELAKLVQQIGGHPVLAMARVQAQSVEEIKKSLCCTRLEAFQVWWKAVVELAPYVASKMPLAVAVNGKVTSLNLTVPLGAGGQALMGPDAVLAMFSDAAARAGLEGFGPAMIEVTPADSENGEETGG